MVLIHEYVVGATVDLDPWRCVLVCLCECVCVCVCERERESVCVCECVCEIVLLCLGNIPAVRRHTPILAVYTSRIVIFDTRIINPVGCTLSLKTDTHTNVIA